jgi:hypothetical protein
MLCPKEKIKYWFIAIIYTRMQSLIDKNDPDCRCFYGEWKLGLFKHGYYA